MSSKWISCQTPVGLSSIFCTVCCKKNWFCFSKEKFILPLDSDWVSSIVIDMPLKYGTLHASTMVVSWIPWLLREAK